MMKNNWIRLLSTLPLALLSCLLLLIGSCVSPSPTPNLQDSPLESLHTPMPITPSPLPSVGLEDLSASYPTDSPAIVYLCPPDLMVATREWCVSTFQTSESASATRRATRGPEGAPKFYDPPPTMSPAELARPPSTPAGNGYLTHHHGRSKEAHMKMIREYSAAWIKDDPDDYYIVWAGVDADDENQGVIIVDRQLLKADWGESWIDTPIKSGPVWIVDAVGDRLILNSEGGTTFYYDLPSASFVSSLSEIVPSLTPAPTFTPAPTSTFFDDVPDIPQWAGEQDGYRRINTDLEYRIENPEDEDWFLFDLVTESSVMIRLSDLPANFGFRVWREDTYEVIGRAGLSMADNKELILENLPADVYAVVVFGIDGAYDLEKPYILRFEVND